MDPVRLELSQYARAGPSAAVLHAARTISASASIPPPLAESIRTSSDIDLGLMNPFQDEPRQYAFKRRGAAAPALIAPKPPVPPVPRWAEQQTSKQQQLSRLPPPSNGASDGRNLVVFIDGPSYQFSKAVRFRSCISCASEICVAQHTRRRALQQTHQGRNTARVLRQRHGDLRAAVVDVRKLLQACPR